MSKDMWVFICGMLTVALPVLLFVAVKKMELFETRADEKITYRVVQRRPLSLHVFHASNGSEAKSPALLLFHGGGWRSGSADQFFPQCEFFSAQGIHCVAAEYRLGPSHAPDVRAQIEDAAAALTYLHDHAKSLGIDKRRIAVGGGSSGGHLAASLGAGLQGVKGAGPQTLVLYNPVLDLSPGTASHHWVSQYWREVSPLQHLAPGFPATLILSGEEDREVPPAMLHNFCATLHEHGTHCELKLYPGQGHGFFNPREGDTRHFEETSERVLGFLHQQWGQAT